MPDLPKSLLLPLAILLAGASHASSQTLDDAAGAQYYEQHIRPLLATHCYSCHSRQAEEQEGELLLDRRDDWLAGGQSGPALVPGDVESSLLIRAVRYEEPGLAMPPVAPLSDREVEKLEAWIRLGAPGPREGEPKLQSPSDPIAGKSHWAFQPLAEHRPPHVKNGDWSRSTIDRFVLAELERRGLQPVPVAERSELIRRVTFHLTGLPPTPTETRRFLADRRPDAFERLVDDLLSGPTFGERWGRHWLDLARYADSNGLDENFLFREAWRYRNWVLDAVNQDLPYDRFLTAQIAGDLLDYDSIAERDQQRIATGFLVVGPKVLLGIDSERQKMDVADEQINTIGRAVLGQTLGCARCHDHKFDPVPTADYYAMAGIFTSTEVMEKRHMLNQQRVMERLAGLGPEGDQHDEAYEQYWRDHPQLKKKAESAKSALEALQQDNEEAFEKIEVEHEEAIAEKAKDRDQPRDQRIAAQKSLLSKLAAVLADPPEIPPRAMIAHDVAEPSDEFVRLAGQYDQRGETVDRGFLTVLSDDPVCELTDTTSGRLELAEWLTDPHSPSGQLAARVWANRIWRHLIGRGLVRTADNFGRTGEPPTHPELLDYLARQLIDSGWSTKALVRQIVLSRTYALSSRSDSENEKVDQENRFYWRAHRRRLEPEAIRDAMLSAAGQLDNAQWDSTVWYLQDQATAVGANKVRRRTDFPCRSVYLPVIRNDLPELFEVFDFADAHIATGMRSNTTVPTQGLYMLNDETVNTAAQKTAERIIKEVPEKNVKCRVARMFELIVNARPTADESQAVTSFLSQTEERLRAEDKDVTKNVELRALTLACHALFASSRFQFLE